MIARLNLLVRGLNTYLLGVATGLLVAFLILVGHPFAQPLKSSVTEPLRVQAAVYAGTEADQPVALTGYIGTSTTPPPAPAWMTRPCVNEDSVNCYWNAGEAGNGLGHSFYVRRVPGSRGIVCVFYVERAYAKHHDYCS